jgi:hypothetical protein
MSLGDLELLEKIDSELVLTRGASEDILVKTMRRK